MPTPIIGAGSEHDRASIPLVTRRGRRIENQQVLQVSPTQMSARTREHLTAHPNISLRSAESIYNCVGMVFASRRTAIDVSLVRCILHGDDYRRIRKCETQFGDVVLYLDRSKDVSHLGMVASMRPSRHGELGPMRILSQWGQDGEYLHALDDVPPIYGQPLEFWTHRTPVR